MSDCCDVKIKEKGLSKGILYGLIPHVGCLLFLVFTVLGVTALSALFKPLLLNRYFFYLLIVFSFILATISAMIYLNKNGFLSVSGVKKKWKYLFTLYGTTIAVNSLLFSVIFPYAANLNFNSPAGSATIVISQGAVKKLILEVDIPCSGHAPLVIDELRKIPGIEDIKFRPPNIFDVHFNPLIISEEEIISLEIFKSFKPKVLIN